MTKGCKLKKKIVYVNCYSTEVGIRSTRYEMPTASFELQKQQFFWLDSVPPGEVV